MKLGILLIAGLFFGPSSFGASYLQWQVRAAKYSPQFIDHKSMGLVYTYLGGKKGMIICFHGSGGSALGWILDYEKMKYLRDMKQKGYSFICPTSRNRRTQQWNPEMIRHNNDVANVENILDALKIGKHVPLILVGHSNGGAMVTRFAVVSRKRGHQVRAAHISNSSGVSQIIQARLYDIPTVFTYSKCDPVVNYRRVIQNIILLRRQRTAAVSFLLDHYHRRRGSENCHIFLNTSKITANLFDEAI